MSPNLDERTGVAQLPPELTARLQKMIWRVRRIIWVRGLLATAAVLLGCALAIMAVDAAVLIFSSAVRWWLSGLGLAAVLATAWSSLARPLSRRLSITRMARVIETRHPELHERISSAIELLSMGGDAASRGSEQLVALLALDAQADMRAVQPRHEFSGRSLKPALVSATVAAVVFGLLFAAWPRQTMLLFKRAVAPYGDFANLRGAGLVIEPGDVVRLQGEALYIRLQVRGGGADRAEVRSQSGSGPVAIERMRRTSAASAPEGNFEILFPSVTESFRYRIRYGAGLSRYYTVTVLPPPAATRLTITCNNPPYTKQASRTLPENVRDIVGVAGTRVEIDADFNRRADSVLFAGQHGFPGLAKKTPGATWSLVLATNMADRWSMALRDEYGFTGRVASAALKVIPDRVPVVTTLSPYTDRLTLPPYGRITCAFTVNEDFGLTNSELVIRADGAGERPQAFALQTDGKETWTGTQELDLARLQLGGVRQFKVWLRVFDSLPPEMGGPQKGESRPVAISLDASAKRIEDQLREEQKKTLQEMLKAAAERLTQSSSLVGGAKALVAEDPLRLTVVQALAVAQERAATGEDLVKRVADLSEHSFFAKLTTRLRETAGEEIEPARARTSEILFTVAAKRPDKAVEAGKMLASSAAKVMELVAAINALDKQLAELSKTAGLALREQALAEQAGEKKMTQAEQEAWKKEQEKIAAELAAQVKADPASLKEAYGALRDKLRADAVTTRSLAVRQDDLKEKTACLANAQTRSNATRQLEEQCWPAGDARTAREKQQKAADLAAEAAMQTEAAAARLEQAAAMTKDAFDAQDANRQRKSRDKIDEAGKETELAIRQADRAMQLAGQAAVEAERNEAPEAAKAAEKSERAGGLVAAAGERLQDAAQAVRDAQQDDADVRRTRHSEAAKRIQQATDMAREAVKLAHTAAAESKAAPATAAAEQNAAALEHRVEKEAQAIERDVNRAEEEIQALQQNIQTAEQAQQALREAGRDARQAVDKLNRPEQARQAPEDQAKVAAFLRRAAAAMDANAEQLDQQTKQLNAKNPPETDLAAFDRAMEKMADAQADLQKDQSLPRADQEQKAARTAEDAAQKAYEAAEKAREAAEHANEYARDREAANTIGKIATQAGEAAKQAEKASMDANLAAHQQQAEERAADARDRVGAAQKAQEAAQEALRAAVQAGQAAKNVETAAQQQEQGHANEAGKTAEDAKIISQAAMQQGNKARQDAQQAVEQAEREQADKAVQSANLAREAAEMVDRAAELAKEAGDQAIKAEHLPNEQRQAQTQQAADKAQQAAEMAKQAEERAHEAGQKAAEAQAAEQQVEQTAAGEAGTPAQILEAAKHAGQEAKQAAKMAQDAAAAARQAVGQSAQTKSSLLPAAAREVGDAAQMADQAAELAERAEQRIEQTEGNRLPKVTETAENKRAMEEAGMAAQLARDAAEKARHAATTVQQEMENHAQKARQGAMEAAETATIAAAKAGEAEKIAHEAGSEKTEESSRLGRKAGEMAKESGAMVKDAMQSAEKGTAEGDRQGIEKAELAAAEAEKAAETARQASAKAHAAEEASSSAREASRHAEEASQQMSRMAEQQAAKQGQSTMPPSQWRTEESGKTAGEQKNRQDTMNLGGRSFIPFFLKNLGFPESEWARYKGKTDSEAMEEMLRTVSPEYRELVRRYFVELSREGSKATEAMK